jgi:ribose/xylose/arabinose/galactoside ABC-type transport system permease subunit
MNGGKTVAGLPESFVNLGLIRVFGIPLEIIILVVVIIYGVLVLNRMPYGRVLFAIGGNRKAAFLMGIPIERAQFLMFVQVGLASSLAGLMLASKLAAATPITGAGLEISALTVVLLGGVAFTGGMGRISGVIAGLFFVGVLRNGLVVTGTSQFLQQVLLGLTLVVAVAIDDTIRRFAQREWTAGKDDPKEPDPQPQKPA